MQTSQYYFLLLDIVILIAPFLANLYFKLPGVKTVLINFLKTYSIVGLLITLLTSLIYSRGDFAFNPKFTTGVLIGNLPIEVVLFLFAVPLSSIALYELVNVKFKEKRILLDNAFFYLFSFTSFALSIVFSAHSYTSNAFVLCGILLLAVSFFRKNNVYLTKNYYVFALFSIITFIIVSVILTTSPFATYKTGMISGFNIGSIPFEDFFITHFIISTFLVVYYQFKKQELK